MGNVNPARALAHKSLISSLANEKFINLEVSTILKRSNLEGADRGLYTALVYGVIERLLTLDYYISKLSERPISAIDEITLTAIRLGIYQIEYMNKIPTHAAVDEAVELCTKKSKGFANAILRSFIRKKPELPKKEDDFVKYLEIKYSTPIPLCEKIIADYGEKETEKILSAFTSESATYIHINPLSSSAENAILKLNAKKSEKCPDVYKVSSFEGVLDGVERGDWFVQDEASAIAAYSLGAMSGETIADTCAAPGGKSFAIALNMKNEGKLYSFDLHDNKISLIKKGAKKLGIDIIEAEARDARNPNEDLIGKCDRVLCDAPCSGFGVIGKKPDIKYKDLASAENLPNIQYNVLCGAAKYVKNGGVILYSTCTILKKENEKVIERFIRENPEFRICENKMKTFLPHIDNTDGFFICKMMKDIDYEN